MAVAAAFAAFAAAFTAFAAFAFATAFIAFATATALAILLAGQGVPQCMQREAVGGIHAVDVMMTAGMV